MEENNTTGTEPQVQPQTEPQAQPQIKEPAAAPQEAGAAPAAPETPAA